MGDYKVLKDLQPNREYAELLKDVAAKIAILEEPISSEMIEQIKDLSKKTIKMGEEEKNKKENNKREFCIKAMRAIMQKYDNNQEER